MNLHAGLNPEAKGLVDQHREALTRLPKTIRANTLVELQKWPDLFEPEKNYLRAQLEVVTGLDAGRFQQIFGGLQEFERTTGVGRIDAEDAIKVRKKTLDYLRSHGEYARWREAIEKTFEVLDPQIESRLYAGNLAPRLVVMIYGEGIALERDKLWQRFRERAIRIPLNLGESQSSEPFLHEMFVGRPMRSAAKRSLTLFDALMQSGKFAPQDSWIIEAGDDLHQLCEKSGNQAGPGAVGLSYDRLRNYRERLSDAIFSKVSQGGVGYPDELDAWLRTLDARPQEGVSLFANHTVLAFIRDIFVLGGNGTLIINNSFVEWSSVEALRRAQPRVLVARFGVRDKMKPFSSLLLFSKPRPTDRIPNMQDSLGSFVDAEMLSYYIWLKSMDNLPYRGHTLYLLLADGVEEMLALTPESGAGPNAPSHVEISPATLSDVAVTAAQWLGVRLPDSSGQPIQRLLF